MKKILLIFLAGMLCILNAHALEESLFDMRNEIFNESKELKMLITSSPNAVLVNSMWDSCIVAMVQLDAYFYMLNIFNTIDKHNLQVEAVDNLSKWLNEIKKSNEVNVNSLNSISKHIEKGSKNKEIVLEEYSSSQDKKYVEILKEYFFKLSAQIDKELSKLSTLRSGLK